MSDATARLALPFIAPGQAQKELFHNEALTRIDALLQADLLFQQLQQVRGLTVVPVNRVAEVFQALRIDKVQSEQQAAKVCELLGVDALVVPTVTIYDAYDPPKFGGALQVFASKGGFATGPQQVDPRALAAQESASGAADQTLPRQNSFLQVADMYDGANGSVRQKLTDYAAGRFDPKGPLRAKEYLVSMDRFAGFAYHDLIVTLLARPQMNPEQAAAVLK